MKVFGRKREREEIEAELRLAKASILDKRESGANISSAAKIMKRAIMALERGRYDEARTNIALAKKHATKLANDYLNARKAIGQLFGQIEKMRKLGMNTYEFESLLAKAKNRMEETVERKGLAVPDYGEAERIAVKAVDKARRKAGEYEAASNAIFVANMILENAMKSMVYVDQDTLRKKVFPEVLRSLQSARDLMRAGKPLEAYNDSVEAEKQVEKLKRTYQEAIEAYKSAEKDLMDGKDAGIVSSELNKIHEAAGRALVDGNFESASLKSREVSAEIAALEDRKTKAKMVIENAENAIEAAKSTGFDVSECQNLLDDAKWAFERGIFQRAINCGEDCLKRAKKVSSVHLKVSRNLESTKKKLKVMRELGIEISNELEEVLEKAEKDLLLGDYVNSNEELMIARVLIGSLERRHPNLVPEVDRQLETT